MTYDEITKDGINSLETLFDAMEAAAKDEDGGDELEFRFVEWLEATARLRKNQEMPPVPKGWVLVSERSLVSVDPFGPAVFVDDRPSPFGPMDINSGPRLRAISQYNGGPYGGGIPPEVAEYVLRVYREKSK